jgi:thiamine biosynthesis lipoprotein
MEPFFRDGVSVRRAKPALGTLVEVTVEAATRRRALDAIAAAFAVIQGVHRLMSFHDAGSDLSRVNRARVGEEVVLDPRTAEVLTSALELARGSLGAFDCTLAGELVGAGLLPGLAPSGPAGAPGAVGLVLRGNRATKTAPCLFDLGGIAKGYAVDQAIAALLGEGVASALVNAGGDLRHAGPTPVLVHLRDPRRTSGLAGSVRIQDGALASSATAGLALLGPPPPVSALWDGRSRTPLPMGSGVSVVAPTCLVADALTKVVLATRDPFHPLLAASGARTVFHHFAA